MFVGVCAHAQLKVDEYNLYETPPQFETEDSMVKHIELNNPRTFVYFNRLDAVGKNLVFQKHLENKDIKVAEIVLDVYRNQRRAQKVASIESN